MSILYEKEWPQPQLLVALGLLTIDSEGYGVLRLTEASRVVLRGKQTVYLR